MADVKTLRERIDDVIERSKDRVHENALNYFVDEEVKRRAKLIVDGVNALRAIETEQKKTARPDSVLYDKEGKPAQELFSKQRSEELKKLRERHERLSKAIDKVLDEHTPDAYTKLEDILSKKVEQ